MKTAPLLDQLGHSVALWNRKGLDLRSDETLVQLLDRGTIEDWRSLYALAVHDTVLADRIAVILATVPLPTAWFWRAALASLGRPVAFDELLPQQVAEL